MSNSIFDITKGNNPILFTLSIPFLAIAWAFWCVFYVFALIGCLIGRKPAFNIMYKTKEWM